MNAIVRSSQAQALEQLDHDARVVAHEHAKSVVVPSQAMLRVLWDLYSHKGLPAPVRVIPNWLDTRQFAPAPPDERMASRLEFGIPPDRFAIAHVGGFQAVNKGLRIVETALRLSRPDQRILLLTAGGRMPSARTVGDAVEVRDLGRVAPDDLARLYTACDLGVVPSVYFENHPLAALEMMSSGLCVVASATGGIPEIVEDGVNGLLVAHPNDVDAWAAALRTAIRDRELRNRLARQGRETVRQHFSGQASFSMWSELIAGLAESRRASGRAAAAAAAR